MFVNMSSCLTHIIEVFVNNTNLTFLTFVYKISIELSLKIIKLPPVGLELTTDFIRIRKSETFNTYLLCTVG